MLNQNDYSDSNQNREQNNRSNSGPTPNPYQPHQPPKRPTRRIGTLTMGVTLILVGIILLVFFFKPFDLFSLMRFSPVLLILLGVMAYKLVEVYGDLSAAKEQEARLRTQVEQKEEENNSLKDALSHAGDPDYILGLARDRLGLAEDGERIFPDVNN